MAAPSSAPIAPSIAEAFALFDEDGDGSLSVKELQQVLQRPGGGAPMSDEEVQAVIDTFDANGDGVLQIEEFAVMWAPMLEAVESGDAVLDDDEPTSSMPASAGAPATAATAAPVAAAPVADVADEAPPTLPIASNAQAKKKSSSTSKFLRSSMAAASSSFKKASGSFSKRKKKEVTVKDSARGSHRGGLRKGASQRANGTTSPETAEKLRTAKNLLDAQASEEAQAQALLDRSRKDAFDDFDRKLGIALCENEKMKEVRNGNKAALAELIRSWDKNNDGEISPMEFRQAVRGSLNLKASNEEIDTLFKSFDADGSGKLDLKELKPALRALQDAAAAGMSEAETWLSAADECKKRAIALSEAAEMMTAIERDEKAYAALQFGAQKTPNRFAAAMARRNLKVDDAIHNWPGVAVVPGEAAKCTKSQFVKGVLELKVPSTPASDIEAWFDEEHPKPDLGVPGKLSLFLKPVLLATVAGFEQNQREMDDMQKTIDRARKAAKSQQNNLAAQQTLALAAMAHAEERALQAAKAKKDAEDEAKKAKLASFKRRKDKKDKEKEEFESRVAAKRDSWTPLEEHFAVLGPVAADSQPNSRPSSKPTTPRKTAGPPVPAPKRGQSGKGHGSVRV